MMNRVILESPYAGNIELNVAYARFCVRDSLTRGEAPIASHLLYTQEGILKDEIAEERQRGIDAGLAWRSVAEYSVFYIEFGWSRGMIAAFKGIDAGYKIRIRTAENTPVIFPLETLRFPVDELRDAVQFYSEPFPR